MTLKSKHYFLGAASSPEQFD